MFFRRKCVLGGLVALSVFGVTPSLWAEPVPQSAQAQAALNPPIAEFHQVTPQIYRGARPGLAGLKALADMGVRTILNLDNDRKDNLVEEEQAKSLGLHYIGRPLSGFFAPSDLHVTKILFAMDDPANYPLYVHCRHGQDRTGLIVGLYRVFYQGWEPIRAYREMMKYHFHRSLFLLNHYFKEATGWDD